MASGGQEETGHNLVNVDMGDTMKHTQFVSESMRGKLVNTIPGIDIAHSANFQRQGITMAYQVLAEYLRVNMNEERFRLWLAITGIMTPNNTEACFRALRSWCEHHL